MFSLLLISVYTVKDFSTPHPTPPAMRLGLQKNWEGAQAGQLIPLTKVVSHTIQHHAQHAKPRERRWKGECLQQLCLPSLIIVTCDGAWLTWEWLNTFLLMRRAQWILFCSASMCDFCFISISSHKFSHISDSLPHCTRGERVAAQCSDTGWG